MKSLKKQFKNLGVLCLPANHSKETCFAMLKACKEVAFRQSITLSYPTRNIEIEASIASNHALSQTPAYFLMKMAYEDALQHAKDCFGSLEPSPHMKSRMFYQGHEMPGDGSGWDFLASTVTAFLCLETTHEQVYVIPTGAGVKVPEKRLALEYPMEAGDLLIVAGRCIWVNFPPVLKGKRQLLVFNFHASNDMARAAYLDDNIFNNTI